MEVYWDLLQKTTNSPDQGNGDEQDDKPGTPNGKSAGEKKQENGNGNAKNEVGPQANFDKLKKSF